MSSEESSRGAGAQAVPDATAASTQPVQDEGGHQPQQAARSAGTAAAGPQPVPAETAPADRCGQSLALRCEELQAQVTSLSAAARIRADIIEEQVARIGDLERHLTAVDALVADLQHQLGQGPALTSSSAAAVSLGRRAYRGLRRRAGGAVRRLVR